MADKLSHETIDGYFTPSFAEVEGERATMGHGRLIKARFADEPPPNVRWYWWPTGNCQVCRFYVRPGTEGGVYTGIAGRCTNPDITDRAFHRYLQQDDCPEYAAGRPDWQTKDDAWTDVGRAAGLIEGAPSQAVEVMQNLPWTPANARKAGAQQKLFERFGRIADQLAAAGTVPGSHYEHSDIYDDFAEHDAAPAAPAN